MNKKICIIGSSGFAKEVYWLLIDAGLKNEVECFMEADHIWKEDSVLGLPVKKISAFNPAIHKAVLGVGDSNIRKKIVYEELPRETEYPVIIHPSVKMSEWVTTGRGSLICAGSIITCDITLGEFTTINLDCTIGHDTVIGAFCTFNPSVNISGNCIIGQQVTFGTNSAIKQGVTVADNVVVGMGGIVVKNLEEPGVYVGFPTKLLNRS